MEALVSAYHRAPNDLQRLAPLRAIASLEVSHAKTFLLWVLQEDKKGGHPCLLVAARALASAGVEEALQPMIEHFSSGLDAMVEGLRLLAEARPDLSVGEALALRLMLGEPASEACLIAAAGFLGSLEVAPDLLDSWRSSDSLALRRAARSAGRKAGGKGRR